ncbi:OmpA family protein [Herbaspirillum sp. RTI4]|nr:OmpA family protein [Herbaspirillum sp. RTI4]MDY7579041.1 OmpA family protein [Herbaspirillum sp. RTI4]MEA9982374.1 OmpA family protein [Herbaspirillum sp. RTI4]
MPLLSVAQNIAPPVAMPKPGQVLISGTVPDEASKQNALSKLQEIYGVDRVVDQISIGPVALPANWNTYVQKLINPSLKLVSRGQLAIDGSNVSIKGEVDNEMQRQQIASEMAGNLNPTYTIKNGLRVSASEQNILDQTLANRTIEFESGQTTITASGKRILDEMSAALLKLRGKKLEVIGHTDNLGLRASNLSLSKARADAVKEYLAQKGANPDDISTSGQGPDRPVVPNDTVDGRSRNRRIEFRVAR